MEPENNEMPYAIPQNTPQSAPKNKFFSATGREKLLALLSFPIAYLYVYRLIDANIYTQPTVYWWYLTAFAACFFLWTELANRGRKAGWERWVWVGAIALCLAGSLTGRSRVWDPSITALFIHGFAIYYVLCRSDTLLEGSTGRLMPLDCVFGAFVFPFGQFILRLRAIVAIFTEAKHGRRRGTWWSIAAVIAAAGLLLWVVRLLRQADTGFEALIKWTFHWKLSASFSGFLFRFFLSLPVGAFLYGLIGGSARMEPATMRRRGDNVLRAFERLRKVPAGVWAVLLGIFAAVYCVFFGVQGSYLFGAFTRTLPKNFTVAEYARQGFFELCKIMALNFVLLFLALTSAGQAVRNSRPLRIMATVILVQSLLLAVTAGSKLWLYIDCFGFTPLRLESAWLICVLAAGCVASLWSVWTGRRSVRAWAIFSGLTLAALHLF